MDTAMTADFFRARLETMIDLRHPLAVLATRMDWTGIEAGLAPLFARSARVGREVEDCDLFGPTLQVAGAGTSAAGRPRLPIRLMVSLLYLKHAFNESDESVCERWAENVVWQFFSGMAYYEPRLPCDATQLGRFRRILGEAGVEELLSRTVTTAVSMKAVTVAELEVVVVDTTVQEKAVAYPTDSRLLEMARAKIALLSKRAGLELKQTYAKEGKSLRRRAGGYAHAKQFKRLRRVLKRQRTILGRLLRDVPRRMTTLPGDAQAGLRLWLERAERIRAQRRHDKNKLYALHAPEVECIGKGKARQPYEFGVKVGIAIGVNCGLIVGVRSFTGNPHDGHTLGEQMEQSGILLQDVGAKPHTVYADLGYRGEDEAITPVKLIHRGKYTSLTGAERELLKRRQAVEPVIGHLKQDHRMRRCWLKGSEGDALNAVLCAAGYNLRWLLRAIVRLDLGPFFVRLFLVKIWAQWNVQMGERAENRVALMA
jgi:IS5 family transposase